MIRALMYEPETGGLRSGGWDLISAWKAHASAVLWIDVDQVSDDERKSYLESEDALGLHPLAVQDALRDRHPPKVERFREHMFLMVRGLSEGTVDLDFGFIEISMFLTPRMIVTRRTGRSVNVDTLWSEVSEDPGMLSDPQALGLEIAGRVIRRYIRILVDLEPRLEAIEEEIFSNPSDALLHELTHYRNRLKALRRIFLYHEQLFSSLTSGGGGLTEHLIHETKDVHDQAVRGFSLSDFQYGVTTDMMDSYLANASHQLNQVMRILTLITVIFVPLSFIAGLYGMNFEYMPELKSANGYYIVLSLMGIIVAALLWFFNKRGWIWSR